MAKWRQLAAAVRQFLQGEAISAAFHTALPWLSATVVAAVFALWAVLKGPAGPWVFLGTIVAFAVVVVAVAVVQAVRITKAAEQRTAVMAETAQIPLDEKGFLDFGAGLEEAIAEYEIVLPKLTSEMAKFGRMAERSGKRVEQEALSSFVRKRAVTIRVSRKFDRRADIIERRVARLEIATDVLSESFVGFVELMHDSDALLQSRKNADMLLVPIPEALINVQSFDRALEDVRKQRIQQNLSRAIRRVQSVVGRLLTAMARTQATCEQVIEIVQKKEASLSGGAGVRQFGERDDVSK